MFYDVIIRAISIRFRLQAKLHGLLQEFLKNNTILVLDLLCLMTIVWITSHLRSFFWAGDLLLIQWSMTELNCEVRRVEPISRPSQARCGVHAFFLHPPLSFLSPWGDKFLFLFFFPHLSHPLWSVRVNARSKLCLYLLNIGLNSNFEAIWSMIHFLNKSRLLHELC